MKRTFGLHPSLAKLLLAMIAIMAIILVIKLLPSPYCYFGLTIIILIIVVIVIYNKKTDTEEDEDEKEPERQWFLPRKLGGPTGDCPDSNEFLEGLGFTIVSEKKDEYLVTPPNDGWKKNRIPHIDNQYRWIIIDGSGKERFRCFVKRRGNDRRVFISHTKPATTHHVEATN